MSDTGRSLSAKRREADTARADVLAIWGEVQRRIAPSTLVRDGLDVVKDKASAAAEDAADFARRRPAVVAGVAAAAAAFLVRKPIGRLAARLRGSRQGQLELKTHTPRRIGARKEIK